MRTLTWGEVWGRRLARHALLAPLPRERLEDAVRAVCGIHAQVMPAAMLSLGMRVEGVTIRDIRAALWERRALVKAHGPRGTVHLFAADDLPLWVAALRAIPRPDDTRRLASLGLEPAQVTALVAAISDALDGRQLTRDMLGDEVARRVGDWALDPVSPAFGGRWPRWQMAIGAAASSGLLCFGPDQGTRVTFVRPDQWLGAWSEPDGAAALREVFRRYLAAYGPATPRDFAQWLAMPLSAATAIARELAGELEEVDVEGHHAWLLANAAATSWPPPRNVVRLLPHFDCYGIGCHPRERLVPAAWAERALTRGAIGNVPLVIRDGVVAGIWRQHRSRRQIEIQVEISDSLAAAERDELAAAATRIGEILETKAMLSLGEVDARPHL
ncbi:MAG TPA: winged helix DNA-binding domain-containing protein [Ktedonobacterales bacterium]|jgi:hypothetical protein